MGKFGKIGLSVMMATASFAASNAHAAAITTLFNTGVDAAGVATTGNGADLHWSLAGGTAYTGGTNGQFPIGPWISEDATSRWITPTTNAADNVGSSYTYSTSFSLAGLDASTASLSGRFAADNTVDSVLLNGNLISNGGGGFTSFTNFSAASSAFISGTNTLSFVTTNFGGPAGLRVEVSGTADSMVAAVPEPATWALMIGGFGMVGGTMRRRKAVSLRFA